jgi:hypothetical protein
LGLVDELRGLRVCIDTAPIIYFIEKHHKYLDLIRPIFAEIAADTIGDWVQLKEPRHVGK